MTRLGIGLVGSGFMGRSHTYAFRAAPGIFDLPVQPVLEVVADVNADVAAKAAAALGFARSTGDWRELVADPAVDNPQLAGIRTTHVPYKGAGQGVNDLLSGQVQFAFSTIQLALPHVESKRLRLLGIGSLERYPRLPDLPTIAESGVKGYEAVQWYGVVAPAGTPRAVVDKLSAGLRAIVASDAVRERFYSLGIVPAAEAKAETHGDAISFEFILEANPDWLFVIDRDAATGEGSSAAILDNELVNQTNAVKNGHVVNIDPVRSYIINGGLPAFTTLVDQVGTAIGAY